MSSLLIQPSEALLTLWFKAVQRDWISVKIRMDSWIPLFALITTHLRTMCMAFTSSLNEQVYVFPDDID